MKTFTRSLILLTLVVSFLTACNATGRGIFAERTAREKYEDKIEKVESPEVIAWKRYGEKVLQDPLVITAPYSEKGVFAADSTDANAFLFTVAPGQKIELQYQKETGNGAAAFLELWDAGNSARPTLLKAADTLSNFIEHSTPNGGNFIVRLQPTLKGKGNYQLDIKTVPILGFPIAAHIKTNIGSFWGADRDAGARRHEGIDIFAKKGSPVVAVTDGIVNRVGDGGIGGKVVWFRPDGEDFNVYYAHLDTQYVQSGQRVQKGQVLGTVGNTGNAKYTPAHLHFGIYTYSGAVDPLAFVQPTKNPPAVPDKKLSQWYKTNTRMKIYPSPKKQHAYSLAKDATVKTVSSTDQFYRVVLNDGRKGFVAFSDLNDKMKL